MVTVEPAERVLPARVAAPAVSRRRPVSTLQVSGYHSNNTSTTTSPAALSIRVNVSEPASPLHCQPVSPPLTPLYAPSSPLYYSPPISPNPIEFQSLVIDESGESTPPGPRGTNSHRVRCQYAQHPHALQGPPATARVRRQQPARRRRHRIGLNAASLVRETEQKHEPQTPPASLRVENDTESAIGFPHRRCLSIHGVVAHLDCEACEAARDLSVPRIPPLLTADFLWHKTAPLAIPSKRDPRLLGILASCSTVSMAFLSPFDHFNLSLVNKEWSVHMNSSKFWPVISVGDLAHAQRRLSEPNVSTMFRLLSRLPYPSLTRIFRDQPFHGIRRVDIRNRILPPEIFLELCALPKLEALCLRDCSAIDCKLAHSLGKLQHLTELDLQHTLSCDGPAETCLQFLLGMKQLRFINLTGAHVTGMELFLKSLRDSLPALRAVRTSLMVSAADKLDRLCELIEARCDPNQPLEHGRTPLMCAARSGKSGAIQQILRAGGDVKQTDKMNRSALLYACSLGNAEAVRVLLAARSDVNACDQDGRNALMFATNNRHAHCITQLIQARADVNITDAFGKWAFQYSQDEECSHLIAVEALKSVSKEPTSDLRIDTSEEK